MGTISLNWDAPKEILDLAKTPEIDVPDADRGPMRVFFILFDSPQIDCDGCGPYKASDVWEKYLRLVDRRWRSPPIGDPDGYRIELVGE